MKSLVLWEEGNLKKECWYDKVDGKEGYKGNNYEDNMVGEILHDALILALDFHNDYWIIDSNTYFYVTLHKDYFIEYVQGDFLICFVRQ